MSQERVSVPTVSIYQNNDYVTGLLQALLEKGILTAEEVGVIEGIEDATVRSGRGGAKANVKVNLGVVTGGFDAQGGQNRENAHQRDQQQERRQQFTYSNDYYLHIVREKLEQSNLISGLSTLADAQSLEVGQFVEFEAGFLPNEANALLDVLSPSLVAAITAEVIKRKGREEILRVDNGLESGISIDKIAKIRAKYEAEAADLSELASSITEAIRTDFRSEKSKEFYAEICENLTAIVVCETDHFITADLDRLLDGRYKVLAKVVSAVEVDTPILARNKLLKRVKIEAVEEFLRAFSDSSESEEFVDLSFSPVVEGNSIAVLPIAIFV